MNITSPIIETDALTRDFKKTRAVDSLDLSIQPGELFGLVGPDGAGKTTTLRLLAGLLNITSGTAHVAGYDLARQAEAIKRKIGYMAQQFSMYNDLSVMENLNFFADVFSVRGDLRRHVGVDVRDKLLLGGQLDGLLQVVLFGHELGAEPPSLEEDLHGVDLGEGRRGQGRRAVGQE